jgi:hypothetical protein
MSDKHGLKISDYSVPSLSTDGAGLCTPTLVARRCARLMGYRHGPAATPSAIQIRAPGTKGVLAVSIAPGRDLKEDEIILRSSMVKFSSDAFPMDSHSRSLSVVKIATYAPGYLNRQAIILMEALGIAPSTLLDFFLEAKQRIDTIGRTVEGTPI